MKQLTQISSLKRAFKFLLLLFVLNGCSKSESAGGGASPGDPDPVPTKESAKGTVTVDSVIVSDGGKVKFSYDFTNAEEIYIGGNKMSTKTKGEWTSPPVTSNPTVFTIAAKGSDGKTVYLTPISISTIDSRVSFIKGNFLCDSIIGKSLDSTHWTRSPLTCNIYNFIWQGYTGLPGNKETTTYVSCSGGTPSAPADHGWWFYPPGLMGSMYGSPYTLNFYWHGVDYDSFQIIGDRMILHCKGIIFVMNSSGTGIIPVPGEYYEYYTKKR